jgi:hypothetical protein
MEKSTVFKIDNSIIYFLKYVTNFIDFSLLKRIIQNLNRVNLSTICCSISSRDDRPRDGRVGFRSKLKGQAFFGFFGQGFKAKSPALKAKRGEEDDKKRGFKAKSDTP